MPGAFYAARKVGRTIPQVIASGVNNLRHGFKADMGHARSIVKGYGGFKTMGKKFISEGPRGLINHLKQGKGAERVKKYFSPVTKAMQNKKNATGLQKGVARVDKYMKKGLKKSAWGGLNAPLKKTTITGWQNL